MTSDCEWALSLLVGVLSGDVASLPLEPGVATAPVLTLPGCTRGRMSRALFLSPIPEFSEAASLWLPAGLIF